MPTHLSFAFGVGNLFKFKFEYRPREVSRAKFDSKSAITEYEIARVSQKFPADKKKGPELSTNELEEVG